MKALTPLAVALAGFGLGLAGCGAYGGMAMAPSAGVTTGGAQDVGLARNQVAAGHVPRPDAFVIEGLLGEHDIDIRAPRCEERFCMHTAVDVAPALDTGRDALFMVVGFSSNVDLRTFRREPLNLSVVVDHSGSMGEGKMAAARQAIHRLVDQLDERDRLSLIMFDDDVDVLLESSPMDARHRAEAHRLTRGIRSDGSTDIESALAEGFEEVAYHRSAGRQDRVILMTDARPNTGRTDDESFIGLTRHYADEGVGLTVFGIGLDFGQALTLEISRVPGANYVYLENEDKLARVFDEDFDLLVTPVAWDFQMTVDPLPGFHFSAAYGVPSWVDDGDGAGAVEMHIPTLFLSRNRGAIVLRLEPDDGAALVPGPVARGALAYREDRGTSPHAWVGDVVLPDDAVVVEADPGVQKAVTLVNTGLGLRQAATLAHEGLGHDALAVLDEVLALTAEAEYQAERKLVEDLHGIIAARLPAEVVEVEEAAGYEGDGYGHAPARGPRWIR